MYKELKEKLTKLIPKNTKTSKYKKILQNFKIKLKKLKSKDDSLSKEEVEILKKLIQRVENKIQIEEKKNRKSYRRWITLYSKSKVINRYY